MGSAEAACDVILRAFVLGRGEHVVRVAKFHKVAKVEKSREL